MLRKVVGAAVIVVLSVGIVMAEEIRCIITKVEDNKVTFTEKGKEKGEKGKERTLTVADKVKVVKGKFNKDTKTVEAGDDIEKGLKNEMFTKEKLGEKGINALVVTDKKGDKEQITEIRVFGGGKKKKDN